MTSIGDGEIAVNAVADVTQANRYARHLEDAEARRLQIPVNAARAVVARKLGCAPGTLENLRRLRTKIIPHWLMTRIRAAVVAELQSQIRMLEHEISIARQAGLDPRDDDLAAAETQVATAKAILSGEA